MANKRRLEGVEDINILRIRDGEEHDLYEFAAHLEQKSEFQFIVRDKNDGTYWRVDGRDLIQVKKMERLSKMTEFREIPEEKEEPIIENTGGVAPTLKFALHRSARTLALNYDLFIGLYEHVDKDSFLQRQFIANLFDAFVIDAPSAESLAPFKDAGMSSDRVSEVVLGRLDRVAVFVRHLLNYNGELGEDEYSLIEEVIEAQKELSLKEIAKTYKV